MINVEVKIFKKEVTYKKDGVDKRATNFLIKLNDQLIPIEVKYFPQKKFNDRDPSYQGRVAALSLIAEVLPEVEKSAKASPEVVKPAKLNPEQINCPKCGKLMEIEEEDGSDYILVCTDCEITAECDTKNGEIVFYNPDREALPF